MRVAVPKVPCDYRFRVEAKEEEQRRMCLVCAQETLKVSATLRV
jgi:hypothetical protein